MPAQAAQLFASLDLNLGGPTSAPSKNLDLPSAETLKVKLNLVRAYITIEDFGAAKAALNEILAVSSQVDPELTIQAQSLMAEIDQRQA
jgi:pilus assembly protein FimV